MVDLHSIRLMWPFMVWSLLLLPVLWVVYVLLDRWFPTRPMHSSELLPEAPAPQPAVAH